MAVHDFRGRTDRRSTALEVGLAFIGATAAASILFHLQAVPFIHTNLSALVAAVFLVLPQLFLYKRADIGDYGFTTRPRLLGLAIAAVGIFGVLPLFTGGFALALRLACTHAPKLLGASCFRALHPTLRWPPDFGMLAAAQVVVVAIPEELFFRGFLQGRLEDAWPPRYRLFGAPVGGALVMTAALFGLGHYLVTFDLSMLTRFFPGLLFGWMYARTRSILPSALFHASCNLLMAVLVRSFLG